MGVLLSYREPQRPPQLNYISDSVSINLMLGFSCRALNRCENCFPKVKNICKWLTMGIELAMAEP